MSMPPRSQEYSGTLVNLLTAVNTMRSLFADQTRWTRAAIVSIVFDLPDRAAVTARFLRTADDFGNIFRQFYGDEVGTRAQILLSTYYRTILSLVEAYKANDMQQAGNLHTALYAVLDQFVAFLSERNHYWDQASLQVAFYDLANLTEQEIMAMFSGDYEREIQLYDELEDHALQLAEDLAYGLVRQLQV